MIPLLELSSADHTKVPHLVDARLTFENAKVLHTWPETENGLEKLVRSSGWSMHAAITASASPGGQLGVQYSSTRTRENSVSDVKASNHSNSKAVIVAYTFKETGQTGKLGNARLCPPPLAAMTTFQPTILAEVAVPCGAKVHFLLHLTVQCVRRELGMEPHPLEPDESSASFDIETLQPREIIVPVAVAEGSSDDIFCACSDDANKFFPISKELYQNHCANPSVQSFADPWKSLDETDAQAHFVGRPWDIADAISICASFVAFVAILANRT